MPKTETTVIQTIDTGITIHAGVTLTPEMALEVLRAASNNLLGLPIQPLIAREEKYSNNTLTDQI